MQFYQLRYILFIFLLLHLPCYSQWVQQNSGTTNNLLAVHFIDVNTGTTVGLSGKILRTINDGLNWVNQPNSISSHLWGVYFANANTGIVAGDDGTIARTTNGGVNWIVQILPPYESFKSVFLTDVNTGYIVGSNGTIMKTTNGGSNWLVQTSGTSSYLFEIYFADSFAGIAVGYNGVILKTTDSGVNWNLQQSGVSDNLLSVFMVSTNIAYVVGDNGKILKTVNGGLNWTLQTSGVTSLLFGVYFTNANTGTIAGLSNKILRTTDGGNLWVNQISGVNEDFYAVSFKNTVDTGTVVGSNGTILHTITGGFSPPPAPNLTAPPNGAVNVSITPLLDWDSLALASSYNIQISTDSLFSPPLTLDTANIINAFLQVQSGILMNNTRYYWRVRGRNFVGFGPWSSVWRFTTIVALPNPPILLLPPNNSSNVSLNPFFDWDSTSPVIFYRLQVSLDSQFININPLVHHEVTGITTSFLNFTADTLKSNSRYYWRVNGTNAAGTGQWSAVSRFTTIITFPPPPILVSPPNGSNNVSLTPFLDWYDDISVINYQLQVASDSNFTVLVINLSNLTSSGYQVITPLTNFTRYFWRVRTTNSFGTGPYSSVWNFTTTQTIPPSPILLTPPNNANNVTLTPLLDWNDIPNCTYRVQVSNDSTFTTTLINAGGLNTSQYQVSGGTLANNTRYWWRVNGTNATGTGPWSEVWNFTTVIAAPVTAPILLAPPNGSIGQPVTPSLDWTDVFSAANYRVQLSLDSSFNSPVIDTSVITSQYNVPAGRLSGNTRYFWRARASNIGGAGPWSEIWNFTTQPLGINLISTEVPKEFKLYYNYPNPFNPYTNIRFDIPKSGNAKMTIYNILGQELALLFDQHLSPGKYEVQWNAASCPSGIYFYQLITYDRTDVKRMVLAK